MIVLRKRIKRNVEQHAEKSSMEDLDAMLDSLAKNEEKGKVGQEGQTIQKNSGDGRNGVEDRNEMKEEVQEGEEEEKEEVDEQIKAKRKKVNRHF